MLPCATAAGVIAPPWATDSSSETLYLTPLLPPGVTFHSQLSSKSPNVSTLIRSPPFNGLPSATLGTLPFAIFLIAPSTTTQCAVGTVSEPTPRQPASVRPSNSSLQPAVRSASVSWLGRVAIGDAADTATGRAWASSTEARAANARSHHRLLSIATPNTSQVAALELRHGVVAGARRERHVGDRRIHAGGARHARTVGHEQVGHIVRLVVRVEHGRLGIASHAGRAHLVDPEPGLGAELALSIGVVGTHVLAAGRFEHLGGRRRHVLPHRELVLAPG